MIKLYKGNLITIKKYVNGRGSFCVTFVLHYRYGFFRFKKYKHTITLKDSLTFNDAYNVLKEFIDNLDKVIK